MVLNGDETSTGFPYRALYRTTCVLTHGQLFGFILALVLVLAARDYLYRVDKAMSAPLPIELRELLRHPKAAVQIFL
jgi:hypothetical protein